MSATDSVRRQYHAYLTSGWLDYDDLFSGSVSRHLFKGFIDINQLTAHIVDHIADA
jgi:hypothetical protein